MVIAKFLTDSCAVCPLSYAIMHKLRQTHGTCFGLMSLILIGLSSLYRLFLIANHVLGYVIFATGKKLYTTGPLVAVCEYNGSVCTDPLKADSILI